MGRVSMGGRRAAPRAWRAGRGVRSIGLALLVLVSAVGVAADGAGAVSSSSRYAGDDRFATAVALSEAFFAPELATVYVATGESFADALAGAAAAARDGAPLLLTSRDRLPDVTAIELARLDPGGVVVLGGPGAVSDRVVDAITELVDGPVDRLSGPDRFATAVAVSSARWVETADEVFVATGAGFADALAGGAAAAASGAPVLLVDRDALPTVTRDELERLGPTTISILGGEASVSPAVFAELGGLAPTVRRMAGQNRFATSAEVADAVFDRPLATAVLATGERFADALAAGSAAASLGAPVLLSGRDCVPVDVAEALENLETSAVVIVGGETVLSTAIDDLVPCTALPPRSRFVALHLYASDVEPPDRRLAISRELAAVQRWFIGQTGDRRVRFLGDGVGGTLVEAVELPMRSDEISFGAVADFLFDEGHLTENQFVVAFVDGAEPSGACGRGGFGLAVYWNGGCGEPSELTEPSEFTVVAAITMHEILHALGAVPECAPNHRDGHIGGDLTDILTPVLSDLDDLRLDPGRDDYFGHGRGDCLDVADSLFLAPA